MDNQKPQVKTKSKKGGNCLKRFLKWALLLILAGAVFCVLHGPFPSSSPAEDASKNSPSDIIAAAPETGTPVFLYFYGRF